jgi:hypothetical protein
MIKALQYVYFIKHGFHVALQRLLLDDLDGYLALLAIVGPSPGRLLDPGKLKVSLLYLLVL